MISLTDIDQPDDDEEDGEDGAGFYPQDPNDDEIEEPDFDDPAESDIV